MDNCRIKFFSLFLPLVLSPGSLALLTGFDRHNLPYQSDPTAGQTGYNQCGPTAHRDSHCQNAFVKSAEDFCIFAPPRPLVVGEAERIAVSYCTKDGYGTRLIPPGTFKNMHFVRTPHYVQITALGDFTKVNVPQGDEGGELDPSGPDGHGNPVGGLVFGERGQFNHWTEFLAYNEFCIRACFNGPDSERYCQHIYDLEGCRWNIPGNYDGPGFDECEGEDVPHPMGEYQRPDGSIYTWHRGSSPLPPEGAAGKLKKCKSVPPPGLNYPHSKRRVLSA
ncbi:hypothetical protein MJO28_002197 [Puccinia striiformis f. sp. tritici]|uniref:Uncharacterized protein n=3 Tax=Puccinia striiformis TaxID=27350 RepID=A0A2S4UWT2_9BASI|nr:hypothetical protein MJO28_002197 [Puccinia striiformis f. sp. tritici]POW01661.1 hypothetical protein PSTT_12330 [Puccinia striiformis]POW12244.1 hypothetical protein PSHT_08146 [Puccinia striiformis]